MPFAGYALAKGLESEIKDGSGVPATIQCPETDAALRQAGLRPPGGYAECPSLERLESLIPALRRELRRLNARGRANR